MTRKNYLLVFLAVFSMFSCTSDNLEEYYTKFNCETANISFSEDIQPIINTNCAISGCHVSGTGLPSWETYENIAARGSDIVKMVSNGTMPPSFSGKSVTIEQVQMIDCWVSLGAPNN